MAKEEHFLDVENRGIPPSTLFEDYEREMYVRGEMLDGGLLDFDSRYVNITGDTMTGPLVIIPSAEGANRFNVTDTLGNSFFTVDVISGTGTSSTNLSLPTTVTDVTGTAWGDQNEVDNLKIDSQSNYASYSGEDQGDALLLEDFDFSIPVESTIVGIEVEIEVKASLAKIDKAKVQNIKMSGDGGSTWSDTIDSQWLNTTNWITETFGSSTSLWGYSWTFSSFTNANFQLRFEGYVWYWGMHLKANYAKVKVYYTSVDSHEVVVNETQANVNFRWETRVNAYGLMCDAGTGNITINALPVSVNYDLGLCGDGVLLLKETTTPTADTNYGKIYTKNDNLFYFQDGANTEHKILYAGAVDISDDTNLAVTVPIVLTDDTLSFAHLEFENLADPGADRIPFWDDSVTALKWLQVSTGLSLSDTKLTVDESAIVCHQNVVVCHDNNVVYN